MTGHDKGRVERWKTVDAPGGAPRPSGLPATPAPYGVCPHDGTPLVFQVPAEREGGVTPVMFSSRTRTLCTACGYDEVEYREGTE